jgi:hypothetical protein
MLIHRQNSYAACDKRHTGCREAQSRGTGKQSKIHPGITDSMKQNSSWEVNNHSENQEIARPL